MKFRILNIALSFCALCLVSCLEDDMAKPRTLAEFTQMSVENGTVTIDRDSRIVSIELDELGDLSQVRITSFSLNDKAYFTDGVLPDVLDLTVPYKVTLAMYYDFEWTISASQNVSRYVKCANQVGSAFFDVERREAHIYVSKSQRLRDLVISDMKLELEGARILSTTGIEVEAGESVEKTRPCSFPMQLDCTVKRTFLVKTRGGDEVVWSLTAIPKDVPAQITAIAPWCWSADVKATFDGTSAAPVVKYKPKTASDWSEVSSDKVTVDGINVNASIEGLEQGTEYEVKLVFNGRELPQQTFVTGVPEQLYNLNFDDWADDKTPYTSGYEGIWDTANPGTSMLNIAPTVQETEDVVSGSAVRMQSVYKMKFAAGNIYVGKFNSVDFSSLGATLFWGYEFDAMPSAMKGYYKYSPKNIDYAAPAYESLRGKPDKCQIQIFLTDWDDRFLINTGANQFVDVYNDPHIIAFGRLESDETVTEYKEFTIPLEYRSFRKPKYIVVSCCASSLGDYFTGGVGSTLLVDEFELIYK